MSTHRSDRKSLILVTGAAGFIGSNLIDFLLSHGNRIVGIDNFTRGTRTNLIAALANPDFRLLEADLADLSAAEKCLETASVAYGEIEMVWHLAANSDVGAGATNPDIDFRDTLLTTYNTLKLMRCFGARRLAFASSSAIYGEVAQILNEDTGPVFPISNYGAMKLASEGIISAALQSHLERAWILRFPNVIGPHATHGVIYDLLRKLKKNPKKLQVLGDGTQCKPYLHVSELIAAMWKICSTAQDSLNYFNIGPEDRGVSVSSIAEAVIRSAGLHADIEYTGGVKGWVGDVPHFSYDTSKLAKLGWRPALSSFAAVEKATSEVALELGF